MDGPMRIPGIQRLAPNPSHKSTDYTWCDGRFLTLRLHGPGWTSSKSLSYLDVGSMSSTSTSKPQWTNSHMADHSLESQSSALECFTSCLQSFFKHKTQARRNILGITCTSKYKAWQAGFILILWPCRQASVLQGVRPLPCPSLLVHLQANLCAAGCAPMFLVGAFGASQHPTLHVRRQRPQLLPSTATSRCISHSKTACNSTGHSWAFA